MAIIEWILALSEYYFSRKEEEQVFLYVDEHILDQVGDRNGLGDHNDFVSTFLVSGNNERSLIDDEMFRHKNHYEPNRTPADNRKIFTSNILKFALYQANSLGYPYYFPYVILAMYYASNAMRNNQPIGLYLKQQFKINNYDSLAELFERLSTDQPAFRNERRTKERIIGLIKYQLILKPSEITGIKEALNRISYVDDSGRSYVDVIRRIRDFVTEPVRVILTRSLSERDYQYRIKGILDDFDLDSYQRARQNGTVTDREEEFALFLVLSKGQGRGFRLLSSYRPQKRESIESGDLRFSFAPSIDRIEAYNDEYVRVNDSEIVGLQKYELAVNGMKIRAVPLGDVVFFYKYDDGRYLQSRQACLGRRVYVFVRKDAIDRWEAWAGRHASNCSRKDLTVDVSGLTQDRWALYLADGLNASYWEAADHLANAVTDISKKGGIRCSGEKNVYLMNALPYFEFPSAIRRSGLTLTIEREGKRLEEGRDYKVYLQGEKLFIDIIEDAGYNESKKIKVCIHYEDPETGDELDTDNNPEGHPVFYIRGQAINYDQERLFRFNKWGDKIVETEFPCIQGNQILGSDEYALGSIRHSIDDLKDFSDVPAKFYFINLLASCVNMENGGQITRERFDRCVRYALIRLGLEEKQADLRTVIRLLVNSGYISEDYGSSHYQAIPPAFIRIPRSFKPGEFLQIWMLTGAYTRLFLKDLVCFCKERGLTLKLRYEDRLAPDAQAARLEKRDEALLPPILLIDAQFDPAIFEQAYPYHRFDIKKNVDQSLGLLSLVPSISSYRDTLTTVPRDRFTAALMAPVSEVFPRIRWDNQDGYNRHYYIEEAEGGDFLKASVSENWNDLYCRYKRGEPFIICGNEHIYLPADLSLPNLIQRSLFIMNVGAPSVREAFVCDNSSGRLYESMKVYKVNADRATLLMDRLTGEGTENNPLIRRKMETRFGARSNGSVHYMELWRKKEDTELEDRIPEELLVLKYKDNLSEHTVAVSISAQESYVMKMGHLLRVVPDSNSIMSQILHNPKWRYEEISFAEPQSEFRMPEPGNYDIKPILIL